MQWSDACQKHHQPFSIFTSSSPPPEKHQRLVSQWFDHFFFSSQMTHNARGRRWCCQKLQICWSDQQMWWLWRSSWASENYAHMIAIIVTGWGRIHARSWLVGCSNHPTKCLTMESLSAKVRSELNLLMLIYPYNANADVSWYYGPTDADFDAHKDG